MRQRTRQISRTAEKVLRRTGSKKAHSKVAVAQIRRSLLKEIAPHLGEIEKSLDHLEHHVNSVNAFADKHAKLPSLFGYLALSVKKAEVEEKIKAANHKKGAFSPAAAALEDGTLAYWKTGLNNLWKNRFKKYKSIGLEAEKAIYYDLVRSGKPAGEARAIAGQFATEVGKKMIHFNTLLHATDARHQILRFSGNYLAMWEKEILEIGRKEKLVPGDIITLAVNAEKIRQITFELEKITKRRLQKRIIGK